MNDNLIVRPCFHEGMYLSADDLITFMDFFQDRVARHSVALHTWGIVTGFEIVEATAPDGSLEIFLQPGYAFDGYGRAIVSSNSFKIPGELFVDAPTGLVELWIRYEEREQQGVRNGFKVCDAEDVFERIVESFIVEAGPRKNVMDRQSGIRVAGEFLQDARDVLRRSDESAPLLCDSSVPYQELPSDAERPRWLIPIGLVNWQAGAPGTLQALTDEQKRLSRIFRRQVGQVTENIFASNEVIRLRGRTTPADPTQSNDDVCEKRSLKLNDFDTETGPVSLEDLVWIEGNLRVEGHARLFGTRLEFRDEDGEEREVPLYCRRRSAGGLTLDSQDLEVVLGRATEHTNRLVIGPEMDDGSQDSKVVITNGGKIGIGALDPNEYSQQASDLVVAGDANHGLTIASGPEGLGNIRFANGTNADALELGRITYNHDSKSLIFGADGEDFMWLTDEAKIGIGIDDPKAPLHIGGGTDASLAENSGLLVIGPIDSQNLVLDGNEIQSRNDGSRATLHLQADGGGLVINQHRGALNQVSIQENGRVGIGTTNPRVSLHITNGEDVSLGNASGFFVLGDVEGSNLAIDNNEIQSRNDGNRSTLFLQAEGGGLIVNQHRGALNQVSIQENGRVGIGTINPRSSLHIANGNDVTLGEDSGFFVLGNVEGFNLAIDNNEIQARNNASISPLFLQREGGRIAIHSNQGESQQIIATEEGHLGVGLSAPSSHLHVRDSINQNAGNLSAHVASFENTSSGASADVLALSVGRENPGASNNFITFFGGGAIVGQIEGNGSGGITLNSTSADFAEYLPRFDPHEHIGPGDVVGVVGGKVSRRTHTAQQVFVITNQAIVLGNAPPENERRFFESVAMVGQVKTKVRGSVKDGDVLIPSGLNDGVAIPIPIDDLPAHGCTQVLGQSWESNEDSEVKLVTTLIGGNIGYRNRSLVNAIDGLRDRLHAVEEKLNAQRPSLSDQGC